MEEFAKSYQYTIALGVFMISAITLLSNIWVKGDKPEYQSKSIKNKLKFSGFIKKLKALFIKNDIIRYSVNSSNIKSIGHCNNILEIEYNNGCIYRYRDVPKNIYTNLLKSDSLAKYIHSNIHSKHPFKKVK